MKILILLSLLTFSLTSISQTQLEMNRDKGREYEKADAELNKVYQQIIEKYAHDSTFIEALRISQRNWIAFRDSELKMVYPYSYPYLYGSVHPMCVSLIMADLTNERTIRLRTWLLGVEEGDVCSGSVHMNSWYININNIHKATINSDSTISLILNPEKDYRIFGYIEPNTSSKKTFLLSGLSSEVKGNPFVLKHGAYQETASIKDFQLKYKSTLCEFIEIELMKNEKVIDTIFVEKIWFKSNIKN